MHVELCAKFKENSLKVVSEILNIRTYALSVWSYKKRAVGSLDAKSGPLLTQNQEWRLKQVQVRFGEVVNVWTSLHNLNMQQRLEKRVRV